MTLEARKAAFKKSWTVGIPTVILCWIICWFFNAPYGAKDVTIISCAAASGMSCFITPMICGLIGYPITATMFKKAMKAKMENPSAESKPAPAMGAMEEQMLFFNWIPKNWFCYLLVFSSINCVFWGYGLPGLLSLFIPTVIPAGTASRAFVTIIGGFQIGAAAQFCAYASNIYFVQLLQRKAVAAAAK